MMIFAMIGWGLSWVNAKVLSGFISSSEFAFWRFFLAAIGLYGVMVALKISLKISVQNLLLSFVCGILLSFYNKFFFLGTKYGLASFGGVLVTTLIPLVTFLLISLLNKKIFKKHEVFGLGLGAVGVLVMLEVWLFDVKLIFTQVNIYFLVAVLLWSLLTIVSSYQKNISFLLFSFYMYGFCVGFDFLLLGGKVSNLFSFDTKFWLNLLLISFYGTSFSTSVYFLSVMELGSKKASSFFFLVPLSAVLLSFLFLGERVGIFLLLGGILSVSAVYILNKQ